MFPRIALLLAVVALIHPVVAVSVVVVPDKDHEKHHGISLSPRGTMQHAHGETFMRQETMRREHPLDAQAHPPTALVDESAPTYVPVPVNNAVPLPAAPVQAALQVPLPTLPAAQAAPASVALPAAGKELAANIPVADPMLPAAAVAAPVAVMAPSAPSSAVSGVAGHAKGNMTSATDNPSADTAKKETKEVLNMVPQTKASALHVLLFGLSVTVALFTSGFVACFMQGRQDKRQHGEPFMPVGPAATRGRGKSSPSPSSRGAGSMHERAPDAMHERDIATTAAQASVRDRLASPDTLDSCW